ncbi:sugar ABC transporter ATP-binding protein [Gordonia sp. DT30]|uniref:sugar ABC transporter ATP-binding protein n=1 Tax=Gordonia sp. DT30 TaxID=3416546 RepID=UPI003CF505D2
MTTLPRDDVTAPNLQITGVRKTFAGTVALAGVDLTVRAGEVHALLGENGSGKSTLIKILSGFHKPDAGGQITISGTELPFGNPAASHRLGARFVHQDLGLIATSSVADNLCLGTKFPTRLGTIGARTLRRTASELLAVAGLDDVDPDSPISALSPALRTGVAVARALRADPSAPARVLVLDEPTATLPDSDVDKLLATVRAVASRGVAVIYVTHRIDEIFDLAHEVTVLRDGRKIAERPVAGLTRPDLVGLLVGEEFARTSRAATATFDDDGETVLSVKNLVAEHIHDLSVDIRSHQITGIAGITGSGREGALAAVFGATPRDGGTVTVDGKAVPKSNTRSAIRAGTAFVPSDRKNLGALMTLTARENLTLLDLAPFWNRFMIRRNKEDAEVSSWFKQLDVRPADGAEMPMASFSGGNQQKVVLAKWLRRRPRLLLLDEPTQGVDLAAKEAIHQQLLHAALDGAAVVVSCSDTDELAALCHRVLVLRRGRLVADIEAKNISPERISRLIHDGGAIS